MKYGLPAVCPKCPPKHYFGLLVGSAIPSDFVKIRKQDICPNCHTQLERPRLTKPN
jgi:hypothetical protein